MKQKNNTLLDKFILGAKIMIDTTGEIVGHPKVKKQVSKIKKSTKNFFNSDIVKNPKNVFDSIFKSEEAQKFKNNFKDTFMKKEDEEWNELQSMK